MNLTELKEFRRTVLIPGLALLPEKMRTIPAQVQCLAIGLQESRLIHQKQIGGPAVGLFQFESGGGIKGVLNHDLTKDLAKRTCNMLGILPIRLEVETALKKAGPSMDVLDVVFARLLLYTDPFPLSSLKTHEDAWDCYIRTWRPGKPHLDTWDAFRTLAQQACA